MPSAGSSSSSKPSAASMPGAIPASTAASSTSDSRRPAMNSETTVRRPSSSNSTRRGRENRSSSSAASVATRSRSTCWKALSSGRSTSRSSMPPVSRSNARTRRPRPSSYPEEESDDSKLSTASDIGSNCFDFATRAPSVPFVSVRDIARPHSCLRGLHGIAGRREAPNPFVDVKAVIGIKWPP